MAKRTRTTTKTTPLDEDVKSAFRAIGTPEVSVGDLANHMKTSSVEYKDEDIEALKRRVNARLVKSPMYARAVNPKTKRPRKGIYRLVKKKTPPPIISIRPQKPIPKTNQPSDGIQQQLPIPEFASNTLYVGKAGEFAVVGELLFRGYNASIMSVDEGIDITASKDNKFFYIQVKTTAFQDDSRFRVQIKPNRFVDKTNADVYYVIVIRGQSTKTTFTNEYFVLPDRDLIRHVATGVVNQTETGTLIIKVKEEDGHLWIYHGAQKEMVDYHLDNFSQIR